MNALSTKKNDYLENTKKSTIFTPKPICEWLARTLEPVTKKFNDGAIVLDPAVGGGNLLEPSRFDRFTRIGIDIEDFNVPFLDSFILGDFLKTEPGDLGMEIPLIINNPPYNHSVESRKEYGNKSLLPDLFAEKVFQLFGRNQRFVMFTPMGFRLNIRCYKSTQGERYRKIRDTYGKITSIATIPEDIFHNPDFDPSLPEGHKGIKVKGVKIEKSNIRRKETQQEIIFFNMPELEPHFMIPDSVIEELREIDRGMV